MKLFMKELREMAPVGISGSAVILLTGLMLNSWATGEVPEVIKPFIIMRFVLGISFASILGAMAFGGENERGTQLFMQALPVSRTRLFLVKTSASFVFILLIYIAYYSVASFPSISKWWPVLLLGYVIGHLFGTALEHTVSASALAIASCLGVYSASAESPFMNSHYAPMVSAMTVIAIIILMFSWMMAEKPRA